MKVKDLIPETNASLRLRVCAVGEIKVVKSKRGYNLKVVSLLVGDETGTVTFTLFGKDVYEAVKLKGKVIDVKDVWVKKWMDEIQISKGRSGSWKIVDDPEFPLISEITKE
ncbi:MAG: hypothetical protein ACTSWN_07445 [Promethearchaeota archaeon]